MAQRQQQLNWTQLSCNRTCECVTCPIQRSSWWPFSIQCQSCSIFHPDPTVLFRLFFHFFCLFTKITLILNYLSDASFLDQLWFILGSCEDLIVDKNGWTGNWQGKLKILLSSDVSDYTITFTTDLPVTNLNFWEGQLTGSATSFTLQSPSYFAGKKEGEYLEHGFQLSYSGNTEPKFTSITFNGVDLCSGGSPGGATEVTQNPTGGATNPGTSGSGVATGGPSGGCLKDKIYYDHGEVTAYGNNPTGGHCGFTELPSAEARKHFVAISSQDAEGWRDGLYCGSCVRLRYTDGHVSQIIFTFSFFILQELIGYIHDSCPSCPKYHWDLSDYMYLNLTNEQSVGKVYYDNN